MVFPIRPLPAVEYRPKYFNKCSMSFSEKAVRLVGVDHLLDMNRAITEYFTLGPGASLLGSKVPLAECASIRPGTMKGWWWSMVKPNGKRDRDDATRHTYTT
jgi:hypothetical protein